MGILLATNLYFNAAVAFWVIMSIVGFVLIVVDKKRWNAQKARSDEMMQPRKKKPQDEEAAPEDEGKKSKKGKKQKESTPFVYEPRIPDKALFGVAICFGAIGELLAMIICRHKWYKFAFRAYMPLLAILNILVGGVILLLLYANTDGVVWTY